MKKYISALPHFFTAFLITSIIIASFAAISVIGEDKKAIDFNSDSGIFTVFGNEYVISTDFLKAIKAIYDFNGTFLGKNIKNALDRALLFCTEFITDAFKIMYGISESVLNNST
jgi:hypothetical protein